MSLTVATLRAQPSLAEFSDEELSIMLGVAQITRVRPGEVICRQGSPGASCFLVVEGELDILHELDGAAQVLGVARASSFIGQIALVDHGPRSATVRARGAAVLLELSRETFDMLLRARSPVALRFQELIAVTGIRQHRAAIARLNALSASARDAAPEGGSSVMRFLQAASGEWGLSLDEVDALTFVDPDNQVGPR